MTSSFALESQQHNKLDAMSLEGVPCSGKEEEMTEATFLKNLYAFMRSRGTPIERIPYLGFKQIDLFVLYKTVQKLGGFGQVTANQKWKQVYNLLGGDPRSTSAATCTRRHYQKLILPFECYLKGQEEVAVTPPQQHKRSWQNHSSDEDCLKEVKRRAIVKQMSSASFQRSHAYQTDTCVQSIPTPVTFQRYSYPGFPPQSACHPGFPSILSYPQFQQPHARPQLHLQPQPQSYTNPQHLASLQLHSVEANDRRKEELLRLRKLAVEYLYSSGWEEPLDLSHKESSLDSISQRPSSFSLPKGNGTPKFLNKVSSMYSSRNPAQDESCEVSGNTATGKEANVKNFQRDKELAQCNATTSPATTSSSAFSRLSSSPFTWYNQNLSAYVMSPKTLESNCPKSPEKEEEEPLNLKRSLSNAKINVEGQRMIEIPLKLLEACVKSEYYLQDMCRKDKAVHPVNCTYTVEEDYEDMKNVRVELPLEMDMVRYGKLEAKRHREIFKTHSSLDQQNIQQTSSVNTPWDREDMSDVGDTIKLRLAGGVSRVPDGDNANIWPLFQCKDPETLKLLQRRWQYVQNLMMGLSDSKTKLPLNKNSGSLDAAAFSSYIPQKVQSPVSLGQTAAVQTTRTGSPRMVLENLHCFPCCPFP